MNTVTLHFKADNQQLTALDGLYKLASNTVEYVKAIFTLGENWTGFDVVRAAWYTDFECISTVLDGNGECFVPWEVLSRPEGVTLNLYGCDLEEESDGEAVLIDRLTTYPVKAILVDVEARVCGSETKPVTPSQFEQYIAIVEGIVHSVKDIDHTELNEDYTLTIYYTDGTSDTVGPIRGEQGPVGPTGNGISKIEKVGTAGLVDTYRITYTNGQTYEYTVTNGAKGETGNGIESIYLTGTSGAVKTYTILFTDGNTFEYQVTDGEVTFATLEQLMPKDTASGDIASFPDGQAVFPLKSCVVNIEPVQAGSGTPSPDNVRPITGWTGCEVDVSGVNLVDWDYTELIQDDSWFNGFGNAKWQDRFDIPKEWYGQTLTYSAFINAISVNQCCVRVWLYKDSTIISSSDGNKIANTSGISQNTFTIPDDGTVNRIALGLFVRSATATNPQVELGSTATTYTPYNVTTYPVSWQTEAGTVYGGTVDLVTGVLMVDRVSVDLGALTWNTPNANGRCSAQVVGIKPITSSTDLSTLQAEWYTTITAREWYDSTKIGIAITGAGYGGNDKVGVCDTRLIGKTDAETKTMLTGCKIVYPLAQEQTYQLDPVQVACLLGQNNVWADCGAVEVEYVADTQLWVLKKLSE